MIYFLTDWQSEVEGLESNLSFNVNKMFDRGGIETQILNTRFSPFINYFIHPLEGDQTTRVLQLMETITERFALSYAPLSMSELNFPPDWEKTYTRKNVLLSKNGVIKAEVFFNTFGFVSQVHYPTPLGIEVETYTEKGTLLCKELIDDGVQVEEQVFDEGGRVVFTQWRDYAFIDPVYKQRFEKETYDTSKTLYTELMNRALTHFNPFEDRLIIDGTSHWLMEIVEGFSFPESVVYLFSGRAETCLSEIDQHLKLIEQSQQLITDNVFLKNVIEENTHYQLLKEKTTLMALFPTQLNLGESNTSAQQVIYWQIESFSSKIKSLLLQFLEMKLTIRELCLVIEGEEESDEQDVQKLLTDFVVANFKISLASFEFNLAKQYFEALEKEEMTPNLRELFQETKKSNPEFIQVIEAYQFYIGVSFRKNFNLQALKEALQTVRIFIDQKGNPEFLSHSLAVSAGIPLLTYLPSPYLKDGKNGALIKEDKQLIKTVKRYLTDPDQWNQNLVESVEMIENNRAESLLYKLKERLK